MKGCSGKWGLVRHFVFIGWRPCARRGTADSSYYYFRTSSSVISIDRKCALQNCIFKDAINNIKNWYQIAHTIFRVELEFLWKLCIPLWLSFQTFDQFTKFGGLFDEASRCPRALLRRCWISSRRSGSVRPGPGTFAAISGQRRGAALSQKKAFPRCHAEQCEPTSLRRPYTCHGHAAQCCQPQNTVAPLLDLSLLSFV